MNIITSILHLIIVVLFLSLPLFPSKYMYYLRWIPFILILIWFIFDGCPLTNIDKTLNNQGFIYVIVNPFIKLSNTRIDVLTYLFLFIIFILCSEKYYKNK
tara:strand:+ start:1004 stop:1306 length:303 start_codon:yes stop_codon:yes gene_type:complete